MAVTLPPLTIENIFLGQPIWTSLTDLIDFLHRHTSVFHANMRVFEEDDVTGQYRISMRYVGQELTRIQNHVLNNDLRGLAYLELLGTMIGNMDDLHFYLHDRTQDHVLLRIPSFQTLAELYDVQTNLVQKAVWLALAVAAAEAPMTSMPYSTSLYDEPYTPLEHAMTVFENDEVKIEAEGGDFILTVAQARFRLVIDAISNAYDDVMFEGEFTDVMYPSIHNAGQFFTWSVPYQWAEPAWMEQFVDKEEETPFCGCYRRTENVKAMVDALIEWKTTGYCTSQSINSVCEECGKDLCQVYRLVEGRMWTMLSFIMNNKPHEGGSAGAMRYKRPRLEELIRRKFNKFSHKEEAEDSSCRNAPKVTPRELHGLVDFTHRLNDDDKKLVQGFIDQVKSISESTSTSFTDVTQSVVKSLKDLVAYSLKEVALFFGIMAIVWIAWRAGWPSVAILGAIVAIGVALRAEILKLAQWVVAKLFPDEENQLWEQFEEQTKAAESLETQYDDLRRAYNDWIHNHKAGPSRMLHADIDFTNIGMVLAFGAASFATIKYLPSDHETMNFMKKLNVLPKATRGFADLIVQFQSSFDWIVKFVKVKVLGQRPVDGGLSEVSEWLLEVEQAFSEENMKKIPVESDRAEKAIELYFRGYRLEREKHTFSREAQAKLALGQRASVKLYDAGINSPKFTNRSRPRPPCLLLRGGTALGKTAIVELLASSVLVKSLGVTPKEIRDNGLGNYLYSRNASQEFWDGFQTKGHKIVLYDDFAQLRDSTSNPNPEWHELIHGVNGFVYNLHMAELGQKANTTLEANMFMLTSNIQRLSCPSLTDHSAVSSRLSHIYRCDILPEFKIRGPDGKMRLDAQKAREACGKALNLDVYRFYRQYVDDTGAFVDYREPAITYHELKQTMIDAVTETLEDRVDMNEFRDQYLNELAEEHQEVQELRRELHGLAWPLTKGIKCDECGEFLFPGDKPEWRLRSPWRGKTICAQHDFYQEAIADDTIMVREQMQTAAAKIRTWKNQMMYYVNNHTGVRIALALAAVLAVFAGVYSILHYAAKKVQKKLTTQIVELVLSDPETGEQLECKDLASFLQFSAFLQVCGEAEGLSNKTILNVLAPTEQKAIEIVKEQLESPNARCMTLSSRALTGFISMSPVEWCEKAGLVCPTITYDRDTHSGSPGSRILHNKRHNMKTKGGRYLHALSGSDLWSAIYQCGSTDILDNYTVSIGGKDVQAIHLRDEQDLVLETVDEEWVVDRPRDVHSQECENLSVKVRRNMVVFGFQRGNDKRELGCMTFVRGSIVMIPYHFIIMIRNLPEDTQFFYRNFGQMTQQFIPRKWVMDGVRVGLKVEKDAWLFDAHLDSHKKDLVKVFITQPDLEKLYDCRSRLVTREAQFYAEYPTILCKEGRVKYMSQTRPPAMAKDPLTLEPIEPVELMTCLYSSDIISTPGQCGGILIADNTRIQGKLAGMLSIGDTHSFTEYTPIYREELEAALEKFRGLHAFLEMAEPETVVDTEKELPIVGKFYIEGETTPSFQQMKTALIPTEIHGMVMPNDVAPSLLHRTFDQDDPMYKGLAKCAQPRPYIEEWVLKAATENVKRKLFQEHHAKRSDLARLYTYEESVRGVEGEEFVDAINRNSSPGHPWQHDQPRGMKGKHHWFGHDDDFKFGSPENESVRRSVEKMISLAREGKRGEVIFIDTLKDELRGLDETGKVKKTRVFSAAPMHFTIFARMYCLGFIAFIQRNRIHNGIAVGINPFSPDWDILAKRMKRHPHVIAGDFSDFDGSISQQVMNACFDIINDWYDDGDENRLVRRVICAIIAQSQHLLDGVVYQWDHSQPSGQPFTALINSIVNLIVMEIAWITETGLPLQQFDESVNVITYGDDNVLCLDENAIKVFHQGIMTQGLAKLGMTYTDEQKTGITSSRSLEEVEFLKRSFRWSESMQRWVAPIRLASIAKMLNWQHKTADDGGVLADEISCALRELSLHGAEVHDRYRKIIYDVTPHRILERVKAEPTIESWELYWRFTQYEGVRYFHAGGDPVPGAATTESPGPLGDGGTMDNIPTEPDQARASARPADVTRPMTSETPEDITGGQILTTRMGQESTVFHYQKDPPSFEYIEKATFDSKFQEMLNTSVRDYEDNEITNFMRTPVKFASVVWNTSTAALMQFKAPSFVGNNLDSTRIFKLDYPSQIIATPGAHRKMANMTEFRGNLKVRIVMNAQPFQCGSLYVTAIPLPDLMANRQTTMTSGTMTSWTSQPGFTIVPKAGHSTYDFLLRPVGPYLFFDLTRMAYSDWFSFYLNCLTPLQDPQGTGKVEISIFVWFESITLKFRTGLPLHIPITAPARRFQQDQKDEQRTSRRALHAGGEADQQQQQGSISGIAQTIQSVTPLLSLIPGVGEFAPVVNSVAGSVGGIAKALGYSKPTSSAPTTRAQLFQGSSVLACDGDFLGHTLAAIEKNALDPGQITGPGVDEMHIKSLASQHAYWDTFALSDTMGPDSQLMFQEVRPGLFWDNGTIADTFIASPIPLCAAMFPFALWNGDIKFTFEAVCTDYHSASLEIIFIPGYFGDLDAHIDPDMCYRQIWNIRDSRLCEFVCPFVANRQWLRNRSLLEAAEDWGEGAESYNFNSASGTLWVVVLNTLTVTAVVSPNINILVSVTPCDNFSWGVVQYPEATPWFNDYHPAPSRELHGYVFEETGRQRTNTLTLVGDMSRPSSSNLATTVGETITSFRQLVKRMSFVYQDVAGVDFDSEIILVQPNTPPYANMNGATNDERYFSWLRYVECFYAFRRGGTRLQMWAQNIHFTQDISPTGPFTTINRSVPFLHFHPQNYLSDSEVMYKGFAATTREGSRTTTGDWFGQSAGLQPVVMDIEGLANIEVPMYSMSHVLCNEWMIPGDNQVANGNAGGAQIDFYIPENQVVVTNVTRTPEKYVPFQVNIQVAGRDDFECMVYAGVPVFQATRQRLIHRVVSSAQSQQSDRPRQKYVPRWPRAEEITSQPQSNKSETSSSYESSRAPRPVQPQAQQRLPSREHQVRLRRMTPNHGKPWLDVTRWPKDQPESGPVTTYIDEDTD